MARYTCLIDVGNTSTTLAVAHGRRVLRQRRLEGGIRRGGPADPVVDAVAAGRPFDSAVIASVVPADTPRWVSLLKRRGIIDPILVNHHTCLDVRISYPRPESIGADRLANATGAVLRYGAPVIVADFGTALTFDVIDESRAYIGGVIAPGLPLMTDYLAERTALLPHISLKGVHGRVGRSTEGAMRLGARVGYRGMVREIVSYLGEADGMHEASLCATGGFARWVMTGLGMPFAFDPKLTLHGLARIHELNRENREESGS